jgi:hypothetical protein
MADARRASLHPFNGAFLTIPDLDEIHLIAIMQAMVYGLLSILLLFLLSKNTYSFQVIFR